MSRLSLEFDDGEGRHGMTVVVSRFTGGFKGEEGNKDLVDRCYPERKSTKDGKLENKQGE
jgi:hypothetical protein